MLDYEQYKYHSKKDVFEHDTRGTNAINSLFGEINNEMYRLGDKIYTTQVTSHKEKVIKKYNENLAELQQNYRKLQKESDQEAAFDSLIVQIKERTVERDRMRQECRQMDYDYKALVDELQYLRDSHNRQAEERKFLEDQIVMAVEAKLKLERKKDDLSDELQRIEEEEDE